MGRLDEWKPVDSVIMMLKMLIIGYNNFVDDRLNCWRQLDEYCEYFNIKMVTDTRLLLPPCHQHGGPEHEIGHRIGANHIYFSIVIGEDLTNAALTMRNGEISLVVGYEILDALGEFVEFLNFKPERFWRVPKLLVLSIVKMVS